MSKELREFQNALIARRVLARSVLAMEHATEKARKNYLHEHPNADPKDHSVAKKEKAGPSGQEGHSKKVNKHIGDALKASAAASKSIESVQRFKKTYDTAMGYKGDKDRAKANVEKMDSASKDLSKHHQGVMDQAKIALDSFDGVTLTDDQKNVLTHVSRALHKADEVRRKTINSERYTEPLKSDFASRLQVSDKVDLMGEVSVSALQLAMALYQFKAVM